MRRSLLFISTVALILLPGVKKAEPLFETSLLEQIRRDYSEQAFRRGSTINKLIIKHKNSPIETKLNVVNRFFNQFEYREDIHQWNEQDYWATPQEFIGTGIGDCEDFVIAKYFALRKLGIPDDRLYLTYVKALKQNVAHMVLSYFETKTSMPLVLDNYEGEILPANLRKDLLPVYSFNAKSLFLNNASAGLGKSLPSNKVKNSRWENLLKVILKEKP